MPNVIPAWNSADLPEPTPLRWRNWTSFVGPGIVMMGMQIGGGEWLFGPEITAKYGGGLMWVATVAIILQVFYNVECGRYALYCGEPVLTGFMRKFPGPGFWMGVVLLLNMNVLIPGLSTHAAAIVAAMWLDRPPGEEDRWLVSWLAYPCLLAAAMPVLIGGKVYNMLQAVMTTKVVFVLGLCLAVGVGFVSYADWNNIFSGFVKFGNVPVTGDDGRETLVNAFTYYYQNGTWPDVELANIAVLGAFAGYAGGGGLANSTYSNFVRDKGWGMGKLVGAIPSALGGKNVTLSHIGKRFPISPDNMVRWRGWWKYILTDQVFIWGPGCFMGMALPALMSIHFAPFSPLRDSGLSWAQAIITADGMRLAPGLPAVASKFLWFTALFTGIVVLIPSQLSLVDDFSRRWTDAIWTGSKKVRETFNTHQVGWIYYGILAVYLLWSFVSVYLFSTYGTPHLMTIVVANLNNLAIGVTALQLLWINLTLLPKEIQPRWYQTLGVLCCSVFYLGLSVLVFVQSQWPEIVKLLNG